MIYAIYSNKAYYVSNTMLQYTAMAPERFGHLRLKVTVFNL